MPKILVIIFAILDSNIWNSNQMVSWADQLIVRLNKPKEWLVDLSLIKSVETGLEVVRDAMKQTNVQLPNDVGDLMAGLILLRFEKGEISEEAARTFLIDIADAYGMSGLDAEAAGGVNLSGSGCLRMKTIAQHSIEYLTMNNFEETDRIQIED